MTGVQTCALPIFTQSSDRRNGYLIIFTNLQTLRGYSSDFSNTTKIRKDSEFAIALPESGMGASEIVNSDAFSGVRVRIFPHRCEPYPVSGVHKMPGFGRSGPFESGRKRVEILVVRLFRPAGGLFLRALAFGSERETQPERDIHRALADGDVLRREFRRRQVGRYEEVDPARAEVQRKAETDRKSVV